MIPLSGWDNQIINFQDNRRFISYLQSLSRQKAILSHR
jgi:hypothetical protein